MGRAKFLAGRPGSRRAQLEELVDPSCDTAVLGSTLDDRSCDIAVLRSTLVDGKGGDLVSEPCQDRVLSKTACPARLKFASGGFWSS